MYIPGMHIPPRCGIVDMDNFGHLDIYKAFVQYLRTLYIRIGTGTAQLSHTDAASSEMAHSLVVDEN